MDSQVQRMDSFIHQYINQLTRTNLDREIITVWFLLCSWDSIAMHCLLCGLGCDAIIPPLLAKIVKQTLTLIVYKDVDFRVIQKGGITFLSHNLF